MARFLWNIEAEVIALQAELSEGVWRPGPSRRFVIHDPKECEIPATPSRDLARRRVRGRHLRGWGRIG